MPVGQRMNLPFLLLIRPDDQLKISYFLAPTISFIAHIFQVRFFYAMTDTLSGLQVREAPGNMGLEGGRDLQYLTITGLQSACVRLSLESEPTPALQ